MMIREETVFGPIRSRRFGSSLGINLLPEKGKICNFDCIYCECGWNKDGRDDTKLPTAAEVREALESKLLQCVADHTPIDSITFSGDGEPTLNPDFSQIIDDTLRLRDRYYPQSKVTVLSNATRVHRPEVFAALRKVDNPTMKIDAPTNALAEKINHPARLRHQQGRGGLETIQRRLRASDHVPEEQGPRFVKARGFGRLDGHRPHPETA